MMNLIIAICFFIVCCGYVLSFFVGLAILEEKISEIKGIPYKLIYFLLISLMFIILFFSFQVDEIVSFEYEIKEREIKYENGFYTIDDRIIRDNYITIDGTRSYYVPNAIHFTYMISNQLDK